MKPEGFDAKAEAGDFKKERAGPKGSAKGGGKGTPQKDKPVSAAQEMFTQGADKTASKSEQISRKANQEFFDKHDQEDERNTEYASQREETRARRIHRQHDTRTRVKDTFIQSDGDFHDKAGFVEDSGAEVANSKLDKLEKKAEKAANKTEKARKRLPQRKEYKLVRHFDEKTGKVTYELQTNRMLKKQKRESPVTAAQRRAMMEAQGFVHQKISENEKENAGVEGAHKTEQAGEDAVRYAGEDIQEGVLILKAGTLLQPQHLGLAASIGRTTVKVLRRLRVALLVTGSELTEPGQALLPGKIYNSNQTVLKTLLTGLGCAVSAYGIIPDNLEVTRKKLIEAAQDHDFILTSGGVSVGEEDHIRPVIQQEGTIHLWRIAVKPGKPVVYGELKSSQGITGVPVIGLPGNPVSVFVTFLLFVRPFLLGMQGVDASLPSGFWLKSADAYASSDDRREFLRARLNQDNEVELYPNQSSGVLSSMVWGDGLVDNPAGNPIEKGDLVKFIPFSAFFHL